MTATHEGGIYLLPDAEVRSANSFCASELRPAWA